MSSSDPPDTKSCSLVGPVALVVQALMAVLVIASLLVKRQYEGNQRNGQRRRKWKVWIYDVGKQLIGQSLIHASNLLISDQVAHEGGNNPCSLYFLNVLVDTTIGVLVLYLALKGLTKTCTLIWGTEGFISGVYGHPPRIRFWLQQLGIYLAALFVMKLFVLALFAVALDPVLLPLAGWILNWMQEWSQVVFVMAVFPLFMNIIQFCLIDSLIKGHEAPEQDGYAYTPAPSQPKDLEQALHSHSDNEDTPPPVPRQSRFRGTARTPLGGEPTDAERGRGRSRDSSRASSRIRGTSRTRRTASRPLTPLGAHSPLLDPQALHSPDEDSPALSLRVKAEGMRRTRSGDGYGSTGSTTPSPVPRALKLSDEDIFPLPTHDVGSSPGRRFEESVGDPDATPRPGDGAGFPAPLGMPSRIDDRVRIQARRSLSNEGEVPQRVRRWGGRHGEEANVVMLDDV